MTLVEMQEGFEEDLFRTGEEAERRRKQHLHLRRLHVDDEEEMWVVA